MRSRHLALDVRRARPLLMAVSVLAAFGVVAGCSDDDSDDATPTATATALSNVQPTASLTRVANLPTPTRPASAGPTIEWMLADSAGAGAIVVRVATDVPTTLVLRIVRELPDPLAPNATATVTVPATLHTESLATGQTDFVVEAVVTDAQSRSSSGLLELGSIAGRQYWGRGTFAPKLDLSALAAAEVSWTNLRSSGEPNLPAVLKVFSKQAGCTVAQQCLAQLSATVEGDQVGGDAASEAHRIGFTFPDKTHDFQVVIAARVGQTSTVRQFYQFDVPGSSLK